MSIILSWARKDVDSVLNGYEVYRAVDKATLFTATNKIASIANKAQVQYEDLTTASNVGYWYGIRSKTVYGDIDSTPLMLVECTQPGAGNVVPLAGDYYHGLVQTFWNDQSFTSAAQKLITAQLVKAGWTDAANGEYGTYPTPSGFDSSLGSYCVNKFWKNGKLVFTPNHSNVAVKGMTVQQAYDTIVKPMLATKPQVEINGVVYELNILTQAEALIYYAGSCYRTQADLVNHFNTRVVPKTYFYIMPQGVTSRVLCADLSAGAAPAMAVDASGIVSDITGATALTASNAVAIAWYFTPANA